MWHVTVASKQVQSGIEHSQCAPRGEIDLQVRTQRRAILPQPRIVFFLPVQSHPKWRGGMGSCLRDEVLWKDTTLTLDSSTLLSKRSSASLGSLMTMFTEAY